MRPEQVDSLIEEAEKAMEYSIAPYSGFKVGAALLSEEGKTYTGCNVENPSVMQTMCAERVALYKAVSEGAGSLRALAVVSSVDEPCYPCGACRQVLFEFAPDADIYIKSPKGNIKVPVRELLPHPFKQDS